MKPITLNLPVAKLFVIFAFLSYSTVNAQFVDLDSIRTQLKSVKNDTAKVDLLYFLSRYSLPDKKKTFFYADSMIAISTTKGYHGGLAKAYFCKALGHLELGDYHKALEFAEMALNKSKRAKLRKFEAFSYNTFGEIYQRKGEYVRARDAYIASEKIKRDLGDLKGLTVSLYNVALLNLKMGLYDESIAYFQQVRDNSVAMGRGKIADILYQNSLGYVQLERGDIKNAITNLQAAYDSFVAMGNLKMFENLVAGRLGRALLADGRIDEAEMHLTRVYAFMKNKEEAEKTKEALLDLAEILYQKGNFESSSNLAELALSGAAKSNDVKGLFDANYILAQALNKEGNFKMAFHHLNQAFKYKDTILNERKQKEFAEMQLQYETEKKEDEITLLSAQNQVVTLKNSRQRLALTGGGILLILVLLLMGVYFSKYRQKKIANELLAEQTEEIKKQSNIISQALDEKGMLLQEINHRAKNNLFIIESLLNAQINETKNVEAKAIVQESRQRVHSISLLHQQLFQADTPAVVNMGNYLEKMIKSHFDHFPTVRVTKQIDDLILDSTRAVALGLIVNELITNSIKYAFSYDKGGELYIGLKKKEDLLYLEVKDNGNNTENNIAQNKIPNKKSSLFGKKLIKGLTRQLRGSVDFIKESGYSVLITIPLRA
ncbi:hypothetical protein MTsPCn5_37410 [Croceitalea sp. MTPC5]|uniref:tetratricopeptide repeat-containing sensor histidine kinase n=1 Tax=Croceitalea sp. MTPC5 TaxID=3056565 RepID=UPI002B39D252|nr:hypothetical protein MTsPCn5_37410 [Croceitalea sp. MTPC5]